ncbi:SIMPL domain-containing protein [Rhodoplanes roseus]|uniref:SIMPL domain-containing protein n=1 Tax=Rhodoplanes roseus TaxID=29409 RepID=A0A327KVE8_9BRAD|nr:SIMPL domain-containing protein [Rhodoplanes roseus]RAI41954.1 hypothetical protein CH341_20665 [Rhodoplanes roseus]
MRNGSARGSTAAFVCAVALALSVAQPAAAQERRAGIEPTLTVRGNGQHEAKPDYAVLTVDVATPGDTLDKAANAHEARTTRASDVLNKLAADGVTVRRSSFRLTQEAGRRQDQPAFRAVTTFEVDLRPVERVNALVGRIAASGLFEVGRVGYRVEQKTAALDEARRKAVADARAKAEVYAAAADMRLIGVVGITDGESDTVDGRADLPAPRSVQITPPAVLTFDASATITWRIGPRQ